MKQLNKSELLLAHIATLEARQKLEFKTMKSQLQITYASLHPINVIKDLFQNVGAKQSSTHQSIGESAIGIVSSYVSDKIVAGASKQLYKNSIGSVVQLLVAKSIAQNKGIINKGIALLFQFIIDKKKSLN
jgi:hypothetical protein